VENRTQTREEIIREIDELNDKIWKIRGSAVDFVTDPLKTAAETLEKAKSIDYTYGYARSLLSTGMGAFIIQHNLPLAVEQMTEAINLFTELDEKKWIANGRLTLGIIQNSSGQHEPAMYNVLKGVDYYETAPDSDLDKGMAYYVIGTVFKDLKKFKDAEEYYKKGLKVQDIDDSSWGGRIYTSLSNIYTEEGQFEDAIRMSERGLKVLREQKNTIGVSRALNDIGNIYKRQKKYAKALEYLFESLKLREESNLKQFAFSSLTEISSVYKETGEPGRAIEYLVKAATLAKESNMPVKEALIYEELGDIYKTQGNFKEALDYTERFMKLNKDIQEKEKESKLNNLKNELVKEKEQEIERLRNVELKEAYNLISEKNKEITDSIHYAKRIQGALMAPSYLLDKNLKEYFVLYKPKDIVSGDFYWAAEIEQTSLQSNLQNKEQETSSEKLFYLAVCDSTGHGVPGAFMSLLNITYLNEAVNGKGIHEPHLIFNYVKEKLVHTISQDGARDGMDGILLCVNKTTGELTYAAANNSPLLHHGATSTLLPADKMPVGKDEKTGSFTIHTIASTKGDMIYLFTDGYADQFGGPKGKKFRHKQLEDILSKVYSLPLTEQKDILDKTFEDWKGALEQVDDVLIIGIKI
jgi:serine phosphatase RsbU (regulator of sigma subunit)